MIQCFLSQQNNISRLRARTTHLFVPSVCHQFCRKTPGGAKRQGGRRLTRGRPRLVLREEIFAWSRRPRSRAAGGSKDGSNLQRQTAPFSSRSLAAESMPRTSDQPWSARGWDPPGCCEPRTAPASSAASFAWATSAPPPRATQLRRRWRREVFFAVEVDYSSIQRISMCSAVRTTALGGACEVQRVPYSFSVSTDYSGESKQHVLEVVG